MGSYLFKVHLPANGHYVHNQNWYSVLPCCYPLRHLHIYAYSTWYSCAVTHIDTDQDGQGLQARKQIRGKSFGMTLKNSKLLKSFYNAKRTSGFVISGFPTPVWPSYMKRTFIIIIQTVYFRPARRNKIEHSQINDIVSRRKRLGKRKRKMMAGFLGFAALVRISQTLA